MPPARPPARPRAYQRGPHLYRRGATWYARGGSLPRGGITLGTTDRAEAERELGRLLADPGRSRAGDRRGTREAPRETPLARVVELWAEAPHGYTPRTLQSHENRLLAAVAWLAARGVALASEITPELVDRWLTERSARVSRTTINRDLRVLRVCLRWGEARGHCQAPALTGRADLREAKRHPARVVPSPAEMGRVLDALTPPRARAAVAALWLTGLRIEELRHLRVGALRDGTLFVEPEAGTADEAWTSKGYRTRAIPLGETAQRAVVGYLAVAAGRESAPPTEGWLLKRLHVACDVARVPRCGLHDLRRAFATEASRAGVPTTVIARWLGHAAVATTERYLAAYRTDREVVAPTPEGAESVLNPGAQISTPQPTQLPARRAKTP